jgi:D-serine deaminase-like pyridoxal phosphate-dependent protein
VGYPEARIYTMSVEHGHVDVSACSHKFRVGERLMVIPQHQETTLNLHEEVYGVRNGRIEVVWPVAGRGKLR